MNRYRAVLLMLGVMLVALGFSPSARADDWNQKTKVTFNQPIEVPGVRAQVLPAGTYVFRLLDSLSDRHIVRIFNEDETHVFTTILAIPNYRMRSTDKTVMTFRERAAGEPQAIRAWFYPGREWGHEFVYPKFRAVQLAKVVGEPVLATPIELTPETPVETLKTAPLEAVKPTGEVVAVTEVVQAPPAQIAAAEPVKATPAPAVTAEPELPQTASPMPVIGLIGLLSFGAGFFLRSISKRAD